MIRALVVEDEPASRKRILDLVERFPGVEVAGEAATGLDALETILTSRPDLVLLDVQLPELDGFEVLDALPADCRPAVLFITAYDEFAIRAFDAGAIDYVLKPFSAARFNRALGRAIDRLQGSGEVRSEKVPEPIELARQVTAHKPLRRFVARSVSRAYFIKVEDVDWIDSVDNYLRLHVRGKEHLVRGTISGAEQRLDPEQFLRVHRGVIVRIDAIVSIENVAPAAYCLSMTDGARITTSRSYSAPVRGLMQD